MKRICSFALTALLVLVRIPTQVEAADDGDIEVIDMEPGQVMLEFIGRSVESPARPPRSSQSGYLSFIKGVEPIFLPDDPPFDETKAKFAFFTEATTTREFSNGPFLSIIREGTTRISYTPCPPCDFANPDFPIAPILIQTSKLRQQAIIDTEARTFTVVNLNTISETRPFRLGDRDFELGKVGQIFRTSLVGRLDPVRVTEGHFAGYAVGVPNPED